MKVQCSSGVLNCFVWVLIIFTETGAKMIPPSHKRFHHLLDNVSFKILDDLSDHEIADQLGTSKEFVRRQRKFLAPRPPVLPQQLKRGIFSMENINKRTPTSEVQAKLKAWVEANPTGYMEKGYNKIAEEVGVSAPSVTRTLPQIIAERDGISVDEVKAQRKSAGFVRRGPSQKAVSTLQPSENGALPVPLTETKDERKVISGHFDKSLYRQLAHLAIDRDCSMQALLVEALHLLFEKEGRSNQ